MNVMRQNKLEKQNTCWSANHIHLLSETNVIVALFVALFFTAYSTPDPYYLIRFDWFEHWLNAHDGIVTRLKHLAADLGWQKINEQLVEPLPLPRHYIICWSRIATGNAVHKFVNYVVNIRLDVASVGCPELQHVKRFALVVSTKLYVNQRVSSFLKYITFLTAVQLRACGSPLLAKRSGEEVHIQQRRLVEPRIDGNHLHAERFDFESKRIRKRHRSMLVNAVTCNAITNKALCLPHLGRAISGHEGTGSVAHDADQVDDSPFRRPQEWQHEPSDSDHAIAINVHHLDEVTDYRFRCKLRRVVLEDA